MVLRSLAPRLRHHAAKAPCRSRDLEDAVRLRKRSIDVQDLPGEHRGLIDRRVRRCLDGGEHYALIFRRREFPLGKHEERNDQRSDDHP